MQAAAVMVWVREDRCGETCFGCDGSEAGRQDSGVRHRVLVAGDDVVEGEHAGEHARHEQHVDDDLPDGAEVHRGGDEDHRAGIFSGDAEHVVRAPGHDEAPGGEGVEQADADDGDVGGARDGAVRVLGLVAEDRGGFEADECGDGEHQADARGSAHHVLRFERGEGESVGAAGEDHGSDEGEHDADLADEQHAEHLRRQVDVAVAEDADEGDGGERPERPRDIGSAEPGDGDVEEVADVAVHRDLDGRVGEQGEERAGESGLLAEAVADEGEERARLGHVFGHRGEADREEQQHDRRDGVHAGEADPVADEDAERGRAADDGEGCRRGDNHEDDGRDTE